MNFWHFFIRRPIFAAVLSIVIVLVGLIAMFQLPIAQYPEIAPPTVVVRAIYPGVNPKVLAETVATPLEQEVNGVENMLYMSSTSTSDGVMTLTITFKLGTDLNTAQVLVQNRVAIANPTLLPCALAVRAWRSRSVVSSSSVGAGVSTTSPANWIGHPVSARTCSRVGISARRFSCAQP